MAKVQGFCPMGCGETLFLGSGGYVTCSWVACPRPDAASDILNDNESEHIVDIYGTTFMVRHPLRERIDDALSRCTLHESLELRSGPPARPGRYRVHVKDDPSKAPWVAISS